MTVRALEIRTLSDRLVDVVRDIIVSGDFSPEEPVRQDALAAQLNVSKIPLREALARLEQDGLVVSYPNRGFFVRPMSPEEAEEIYALRIKLEPDAVARACQLATKADHENAERALALFDVEAAAQRPTVGALNRAFHMALIRPSDQLVTIGIVERLHVMADRYVRKHLSPRGRYLLAEAEHHDILKAWTERRADVVAALVTAHLRGTLDDLRRELNQAVEGASG
nr:GntR family transcriptional regulator [uncultured Brevundimonas sp.]